MRWVLILLILVLPSNISAQPVVMIADGDSEFLDLDSNGRPGLKANTSLTSGYRQVITAGTAIQLSGSVAIFSVTVKASSGNSDNIYLGGSDVNQYSGIYLDAGEEWTGTIDNLNKIYIDADTADDSVGFVYEH